MSLSETPTVNIAPNTAQNVSDEIFGGTIQFCRETGYKSNIIMLTLFWSAFLFAAKKELREHGLAEEIMRCYTHSLAGAFPNLSEDKELEDKISETCQRYWRNLSNDFQSLNTETEISAFFQIANKLNSQDDIASNYLLKGNPQQSFLKISNTINSNIYRILRQIDNDFGIQYKGVLDQLRFARLQATQTNNYNTPSTTPMPSSTSNPPQKKQMKKSTLYKILFIVAVVIIGIILVNRKNVSEEASKSTPEPKVTVNPTYAPALKYIPVAEPKSGTILTGTEDLFGSEITVAASRTESCVVKLKTSSGATRLSFFVRAGETVTVGVPDEYLYVYFAAGDTWYGEKVLFGEDTYYSMDDEICDFTKYTWEYTLYPVTSGNFTQTPIDKEDF